MSRYAARLLQTLMDYVGDLDIQPQEIVLPEQAYLLTALGFQIFDKSAPPRYVIEPLASTNFDDPQAPNAPIYKVFVGDSFVAQGPAGPCVVRCKKS